MEGAVVPEACQRVGLRLALERRADVRVVDRERRGVAEPHREEELVLGELLEAGAVDVERALEPAARNERDDDQRLGIGRRVRDEADPRVELRAVREHGLAVLDRPAGDPDAVGERLVGEHLLRVLAGCEHRTQLALRLVGLVERDVVERDQLADGVGDPLEQVVERLLREHLVEDVGELAVRLDERVERRIADDTSLAARGRDVRRRIHCPLLRRIGICGRRLERFSPRRPGGSGMMGHGGKIVVGVDGSEDAAAALRWAAEEAKLRGARVEAVHAWTFVPMTTPADSGLVPMAWTESTEMLDVTHEAAERGSPQQQVTRACSGRRHDVARLARGGRRLRGAARRRDDADLLVVGNRGRGDIEDALLGSTSAASRTMRRARSSSSGRTRTRSTARLSSVRALCRCALAMAATWAGDGGRAGNPRRVTRVSLSLRSPPPSRSRARRMPGADALGSDVWFLRDGRARRRPSRRAPASPASSARSSPGRHARERATGCAARSRRARRSATSRIARRVVTVDLGGALHRRAGRGLAPRARRTARPDAARRPRSGRRPGQDRGRRSRRALPRLRPPRDRPRAGCPSRARRRCATSSSCSPTSASWRRRA